METDVVTLLRRRWWVLALVTVLGAVAALATRDDPGDTPAAWQAKATIVGTGDPTTAEQQVKLRRLGASATRPPVVDQVADEVGIDVEVLRAATVAALNTKFGGVDITVTLPDRDDATAAADGLALAVVEQADSAAAARSAGQTNAIDSEVAGIRARLTELATALTAGRDATLIAERDALRASLAAALARRGELAGTASAGGDVLASLEPVDVSDPGATTSPVGRAVGGLLVGLAVAAIAVVLADRLDPRIRDRRQVELAYGTRVLAGIAADHAGLPGGGVPVADGHRVLRLALREGPAGRAVAAGRHERTGSLRADGEVQVVVVASAERGDGRSTTTANLAAALAEVGWEVVLVDADHARPALHDAVAVPRGPGLVEAAVAPGLDDPESVDLAPSIRPTGWPGVSLLAAGGPATNPGALATRQRAVVRALRGWADYVVVDTPPLLEANDALELAGEADAVVLVARQGHTRRQAAARARELLELVGAPVTGALLLGGSALPETGTVPATTPGPAPAATPVAV